jgi:hypothetical protein
MGKRAVLFWCFFVALASVSSAETAGVKEDSQSEAKEEEVPSAARRRYFETEDTIYDKITELNINPEQLEATFKKTAPPEAIAAAKEKFKNAVLEVNNGLKEKMQYYIYNEWMALSNKFSITFNPYVDPFEERYKATLSRLYLLYSKSAANPKAALDKISEFFGQEITDKLNWLFKYWGWWNYYCYQESST